MRPRFLAAGLAALLASATAIAGGPGPAGWAQDQPIKRVDHDRVHQRSQNRLIHHRNRFRAAAAAAAVSQDVGDVAVLVDNGAMLIPARDPNLRDLPLPVSLSFVPTADGFSVSMGSAALDPQIGDPLTLGDDDTREVALGFAFPYLGAAHPSVWINSDGNLTFGAGDTELTPRDAARLIGGPPRIAPLLNDLNPSAGGTVHARVAADRLVVTWTDVPEFGFTNANTFQATLLANGTIVFAYARLEAPIGVIGVAEGRDEGPINEIDLTADLPAAFAAGAIFEEFAQGHGTQVDIVEVASEFYRTHPDSFDFLVTFTDFAVDLGDAFAFEAFISNATRGIGVPILDFSAEVGSGGELESFLMMNDVGIYWPDARKQVDPPLKMFSFPGFASLLGPPGSTHFSRRLRILGSWDNFGWFSLGLNSPMSVMGQEAGHRWAAFVPFVHPTTGVGPDSADLLGRGFAHWSFFFNVDVPPAQFGGDPRASSMEGNTIIDFGGNVFGDCVNPGETRFRTQPNELIDGYTELDQYLLGLRTAAEVAPFWYIDRPTRPSSGISFEDITTLWAVDDVGICGRRVNLTVDNIRNFPGIGPRVPAIGDEVDHDAAGNPRPDHKTMAFILLVTAGTPQAPGHAAAIAQVDTFRQTWQAYVNGPGTGGRGRFDTVLRPAVH